MDHYRSLNDDGSLSANAVPVVVSGNDLFWTRFLERHPNLQLALNLALVASVLLFLCSLINIPLEFSVAVSGFQGLEPSTRTDQEGTTPTFGVTLRVKNRNVWARCFKTGPGGSAVVAYAGVPLARAHFPGFCVPRRSVAEVRFVAAGGGLGMPGSLFESLEAQRGRREPVQLTVRVRLDEIREPSDGVRLLVWCQAMLDRHRPNGPPSRCTPFKMRQRWPRLKYR